MLIDDQLRKCAAVLCRDIDVEVDGMSATQRVEDATVFFVSIPVVGEWSTTYVVTARHASHGPAWLRLNFKEGRVPAGSPGYMDVPVDPAAWIRSEVTDVAVAGLTAPPNIDLTLLDFQPIPITGIAHTAFESALGLGDEVVFISLFTPSPGQTRFEPIARFGNISRLPKERIRIQVEPGTYVRVNAYLVEARSWGGHSGSPAFAYYNVDRGKPPGLTTITSRVPPVLMGLVSGHFPIPISKRTRDSLGSQESSANSGMAAVIPGQAIVDLLMSDELVKIRERAIADWTAAHGEDAIQTDSLGNPIVTPNPHPES